MNADKHRRIMTLTQTLLDKNDAARRQFVERTPREDYAPDFYGEVKPFADEVSRLLDEWKPLVIEWIRSEHPPYLHIKQIEDTYDNLMIISVTAFQKDTRRRRFMNTIQSIDYVLRAILQALNSDE